MKKKETLLTVDKKMTMKEFIKKFYMKYPKKLYWCKYSIDGEGCNILPKKCDNYRKGECIISPYTREKCSAMEYVRREKKEK